MINSKLSDLQAANPAGGDLIYIVQGGNSRQVTLGSLGAQLLDDTGQTAARATIGAVIGTNVQAWNANLDELATVNAGTTGKALLDDTGVTQAVETLGLTYVKDYGAKSVALRKFRPGGVAGGDPTDWTATLQAAADSAEPTILVHGDSEVTFEDQWSIDTDGQKWIGVSMVSKSYLRRTTDVDEAAILVTGESCGFRHIGLKGVDYTSGGGVAKTAANAGIFVARPANERVDLDFEFRDGYISEFYYLISGQGRGITVVDNLLSSCRYACNFDWPAPGTYDGDNFVGDQDGNGFRRQVFARNEVHSIAVAAVRNLGDVGGTTQAANIHCVIENNKSNFGKGMFNGYLGDGSVIQGNVIQNASNVDAAYNLSGGTNWIMANNRVYADRTSGGFPEMESFIKITGQHTGFIIDGFSARGCTAHGIDMRSGDFTGILRNIDLARVSSADSDTGTGSTSGVLVIGTGASTEIMVDGVTLRNSGAAQSVVRMATAGSVLKHRGIVALGAATPLTSGSGTFTAV